MYSIFNKFPALTLDQSFFCTKDEKVVINLKMSIKKASSWENALRKKRKGEKREKERKKKSRK